MRGSPLPPPLYASMQTNIQLFQTESQMAASSITVPDTKNGFPARDPSA
jgi:hypothetical protein